jgi:hypothetical protein
VAFSRLSGTCIAVSCDLNSSLLTVLKEMLCKMFSFVDSLFMKILFSGFHAAFDIFKGRLCTIKTFLEKSLY